MLLREKKLPYTDELINRVVIEDLSKAKANGISLDEIVDDVVEQLIPDLEQQLRLLVRQALEEKLPEERSFRTVPSAGARHAFETFLLVNNVSGLERGIYRYIASNHKLIPVDLTINTIEQIISDFNNINLVAGSAVTFMWSCVADRMTWKFGKRGFRYLLLDAGHICQNLYLAAESIDCGCCAIGVFDDEEINMDLKFNNIKQFLVYAASVGKKLKKT